MKFSSGTPTGDAVEVERRRSSLDVSCCFGRLDLVDVDELSLLTGIVVRQWKSWKSGVAHRLLFFLDSKWVSWCHRYRMAKS